jgi:hypothetical protein
MGKKSIVIDEEHNIYKAMMIVIKHDFDLQKHLVDQSMQHARTALPNVFLGHSHPEMFCRIH